MADWTIVERFDTDDMNWLVWEISHPVEAPFSTDEKKKWHMVFKPQKREWSIWNGGYDEHPEFTAAVFAALSDEDKAEAAARAIEWSQG